MLKYHLFLLVRIENYVIYANDSHRKHYNTHKTFTSENPREKKIIYQNYIPKWKLNVKILYRLSLFSFGNCLYHLRLERGTEMFCYGLSLFGRPKIFTLFIQMVFVDFILFLFLFFSFLSLSLKVNLKRFLYRSR